MISFGRLPPREVSLIASIGIALTPTFLCAMTGMALLVILDAVPTLGYKRSARAILLGVLIISFSILCAILLQLRMQPLVMLTLATSAMLFMLPATLRIALRAREGPNDTSPWLWRWRSRPGRGGVQQQHQRLNQVEKKLLDQPMDAILRLRAMELALAVNENSRALYHAHLLDEILPQGSAHAHVLRSTCEIMVKKQHRPADAICTLGRLEKLYPSQPKILQSDPWPNQNTTTGNQEKL